MTARCSVLIPYFNAGDSLISSLESIDGLLDGSVDALVVDDGSQTCPARSTLRGTDLAARVRVFELDANQGIAQALNAGLQQLWDRYEFVARLDCGDMCVGDRLQAQMDYLDAHPECALVGTWTAFHSPTGQHLYTVRHPVEHSRIMRRMHINCAFTHPTVMFRSNLIRTVGLYPYDREAAEDHAYFFDIGMRFPTANIGRVHVQALIDPEGISNRRRRRQIRSRLTILLEHFDFRPVSVYGILRATVQLLTPRQSTVVVRSSLRRLDLLRRRLRA